MFQYPTRVLEWCHYENGEKHVMWEYVSVPYAGFGVMPFSAVCRRVYRTCGFSTLRGFWSDAIPAPLNHTIDKWEFQYPTRVLEWCHSPLRKSQLTRNTVSVPYAGFGVMPSTPNNTTVLINLLLWREKPYFVPFLLIVFLTHPAKLSWISTWCLNLIPVTKHGGVESTSIHYKKPKASG